ncbi:MAG: glycine--tRNA ligase [Planctomycetia bacterium]|nr:glycine--tRNA ligase [Planctomycetia bacterium]
MDKLVSLCKRRGFLFQSSEIYGGLNGFWDYGPLGVELKRNVKESWWRDMITAHDDLATLPGAPEPYEMVGLDSTIIMHPQIWKVSGHYDLFVDKMVDCRTQGCNGRFRIDHIPTSECPLKPSKHPGEHDKCQLTEPRDFNLMFKTIIGALGTEEDTAFLRPETAQGIFVNFKNVCDSTRVRIPFGIAQVGKSFRNEITPRNFTFRSREFEQMEIEFFCHPSSSQAWYKFWRDRRYQWYLGLGLAGERLQLREHHQDELSHYSTGTADIEYAFPFLQAGEFGELEGIAHRGDFDLRSHMEGKLDPKTNPLTVELSPDGKTPKWRGSGKDLTYRNEQTNERFTPHVIEPSAGADRATLAFLCEAYREDEAPDESGKMQVRTVLKLHPRLAPIKAAVFPLVKKDGMPEIAQDIYRALKKQLNVFYDEKGAIGRRYRRQDEAGTPYCITVDGQTLTDKTVTIRDRDSLKQWRIKVDDCAAEVTKMISGE